MSTVDALALIPIVGDEAHPDHNPETTPQHLIDNFLGMQLSLPHPVNGMLNAFNFILKYCIPPPPISPPHLHCLPKTSFHLCLPPFTTAG
jgi:hypothetical protein